MLFVMTPRAVVLSVCLGVICCGWPISSRVILISTAFLAFYGSAIASNHLEVGMNPGLILKFISRTLFFDPMLCVTIGQ